MKTQNILVIMFALLVGFTIFWSSNLNAATNDKYIKTIPPKAAFSAANTTGLAPMMVQFSNSSTGDFDNVLWDFGDGTTSTLITPTHTYIQSGSYNVSLVISGTNGIDSITKKDFITIYTPCYADFEATPIQGIAPLTVAFTNTTTGDCNLISWNFSDGSSTTNELNPTHTFFVSDTYTVTLTANGFGGTNITKSQQIKVIGYSYSVTNVVITPSMPTINDNLVLTYQADTEVKIRWYINGLLQYGLDNMLVISANLFSPPQVWQAEVRACFNGTCSKPVLSNEVFIVSRPNELPTVTVTVQPISPLDDDNLVLSYTYYDADGDLEGNSQIRWTRNEVYQPAFSNQTVISSENTYPGETWCVTVYPHDGKDYGITNGPYCVVIGSTVNHSPLILQPKVQVSRWPSQYTLTLSYVFTDADNDAESLVAREIHWYRNSMLQPQYSNQLAIQFSQSGDIWYATIRPHDGKTYGLAVATNQVAIANPNVNTPPFVNNARIMPTTPTDNDNLTLQYDYTDIDSDSEDGTLIYWYETSINPHSRLSQYDGLTIIPAVATQIGQVWYAMIIPKDGLDFGEAIATEHVQITADTNTAPEVKNVRIVPAQPGVENDLELDYDYIDANGDREGATEIHWVLNGVIQIALDNQTIVPAALTRPGDIWLAAVTPVDVRGKKGQLITSNVVTVLQQSINTPPTIVGTPYLDPSHPFPGEIIILYYNYFDTDNDLEGTTQIHWYVNGKQLPQYNYLKFLRPSTFTQSDVLSATIQVHDGKEYGDLKQTNNITVSYLPDISVYDVNISPYRAKVNDVIKLDYKLYTSTSIISNDIKISWFKNEKIFITYTDKITIPAFETDRGDRLYAQIEFGNKYKFREVIRTDTITINRLPQLARYYLRTTSSHQDPLTLEYVPYDADNDPITPTITWYRNGSPLSYTNGVTMISSSLISPGDRWSAKLQVCDELECGEEKSTPSIYINYPPKAQNLRFVLSMVSHNQAISVVYEHVDPDGTKNTPQVYWYIDNQLQNTYNRQEFLPENIIKMGQHLKVILKPCDEIECGEAETITANVLASPIYLPLLLKIFPPPNPKLLLSMTADRAQATLWDTIQYTYYLTNTGNVPLDDLTLTDNRLGNITLDKTSLAPNEVISGQVLYQIRQSDLFSVTNQATVKGKYGEQQVEATSQEVGVMIPTTELWIKSENTGGLTFELKQLTDNSLVISCVIGNNVTQYCGNFQSGRYRAFVKPQNCNGVSAENDYKEGKRTQPVKC